MFIGSTCDAYDIALEGEKFPLAENREESRLKSLTGQQSSFSNKASSEYHTPCFSEIYHLFQAFIFFRILTERAFEKGRECRGLSYPAGPSASLSRIQV